MKGGGRWAKFARSSLAHAYSLHEHDSLSNRWFVISSVQFSLIPSVCPQVIRVGPFMKWLDGSFFVFCASSSSLLLRPMLKCHANPQDIFDIHDIVQRGSIVQCLNHMATNLDYGKEKIVSEAVLIGWHLFAQKRNTSEVESKLKPRNSRRLSDATTKSDWILLYLRAKHAPCQISRYFEEKLRNSKFAKALHSFSRLYVNRSVLHLCTHLQSPLPPYTKTSKTSKTSLKTHINGQ